MTVILSSVPLPLRYLLTYKNFQALTKYEPVKTYCRLMGETRLPDFVAPVLCDCDGVAFVTVVAECLNLLFYLFPPL